MHLRSLTTGKGHPHATNPRLVVEAQPRAQEDDYSIQCADDFIGILFKNEAEYEGHSTNSNDLVIWNWKTGQIVFVRFDPLGHLLL